MKLFRVSAAFDRYVTNAVLAGLLAAMPLSAVLFVFPPI